MAEPSNIEKVAEAPAPAEPEIEIEIVDAVEETGEDTTSGADKQEDVEQVEEQADSAQQAERKSPNRVSAKKRIDEVTRARREAERLVAMRDAQIEHMSAEHAREIKEIKEQIASLASTYTADTMESRIRQAEDAVAARTLDAERRLVQAKEQNDFAAETQALKDLMDLSGHRRQIADAKAQHQRERDKPAPKEQPKQEQRPQLDPQHVYRVNKWVDENDWFRTNRHLNAVARAIDDELSDEYRRTGRFDPRADERYQEITRRMEPYLLAAGVKEPEPQAPQKEQPQHRPPIVSAVSGVTRTPAATSPSTKMKLTREEVQIAEKLGVSLQDYAAQKLRREQRIASQ